MSRPRLQHYVTRAYLDGFLADGETKIHVYARGKETSFRAKPENVAAIHNYYSSKRPDGTYDDRIEELFANTIEGPGIKVIRRLNAGHYDISKQARVLLSTLLAIQEYRVPWMREQMETFTTEMLQRFSRRIVDSEGLMEETIKELALSEPGMEHDTAEKLRGALRNGDIEIRANSAASMHAMGHLLETLPDIYFTMGWEVLETTSIPFITSDCPVHRYYVPIGQDIPYGGLMDTRVHVRFPLCKTKMLVIRHDLKRNALIEEVRRRKGSWHAQKMANRASQIRNVRITAGEVDQINAHTASMAARFIFSPLEMTNGTTLMKGECRNVRHEFTDLPGGLTKFQAIYPA